MFELDPILIDRSLQKAAQTAVAWQRRLKRQPDMQDAPLASLRSLLSQPRFEQVSELPDYDPLRIPLRRWIFKLAEQRINHYWITRWHELRYSTGYEVDEPVRDEYSLDELLQQALTDDRRRQVWSRSLLAHCRANTDCFVTLTQRRQEISKRLGLDSPNELEYPDTPDSLEALADDWLQRTDSLAAEFKREHFADWVAVALGSEAHAGFPAALKEHTLAHWFRSTRLLEDLRLDTPRLPARVAPSSFMRALEIMGFGMRDAGAPQDLPFTIAHDPQGLEAHTLGWLFAQLLTSNAFLERNLELDRGQQRDHQRVLGRVLLLESRIRALKLKLRRHALSSAGELEAAYPELVFATLGCQLPSSAAGVLLRQRTDDGQRFCSSFLGAAKAAEFVEAHDDDWYRNPRATDQIRSELSLPPVTSVPAEQLAEASQKLERTLTLALQ